jgi:hypothetical protein
VKAHEFIASVAATLTPIKGKDEKDATPVNGHQCTLTTEERRQISDIAKLLLTTHNCKEWPSLQTVLWGAKEDKNTLQILRFLAENGFHGEIREILLHRMNEYSVGEALSFTGSMDELDEIIAMLPSGHPRISEEVVYHPNRNRKRTDCQWILPPWNVFICICYMEKIASFNRLQNCF